MELKSNLTGVGCHQHMCDFLSVPLCPCCKCFGPYVLQLVELFHCVHSLATCIFMLYHVSNESFNPVSLILSVISNRNLPYEKAKGYIEQSLLEMVHKQDLNNGSKMSRLMWRDEHVPHS